MENNKKYTYVMIKPYSENNAVNTEAQKVVLKEVLRRLKKQGLTVLYQNRIQYTKEATACHYQEHVGKPFYPSLENCLLKNKAVGMVVADSNFSEDVITKVRSMAGATIKVDKKTGEIKLPEPGSIRYNMFFTLFQIKNGVELDNVAIPENVDDCQKVVNEKENCIDIFKDGNQICKMYMTENLIHTSSSVAEAENEISNFFNLCQNKIKERNEKEQEL